MEGNKLQRQKILILIYPIYYNNWRNISTIYEVRSESKTRFAIQRYLLIIGKK